MSAIPMSDSDDEPMDEAAAERRAKAMQILAKVLHKPADQASTGGAAAGGDAASELSFMRSLLELKSRDAMVRMIRDRVNVLAVRTGEVTFSPSETRAARVEQMSDEHPPAEPPPPAVRDLLERVQAGDVSCIAPAALEVRSSEIPVE